MALARVTSNFVNQTTTSTTIPIAWTPASAGNMLIVSVIWNTSGTPSIADTNTNTWVSTCPATLAPNGTSAAMWYTTSAKAGATTITVTVNSCSYRTIFVSEWSGQDQTAAFDQHSEATGTSTVANSGSKTTLFANEVIYGFAASGPSSLAAGASFTAETNNGNGEVPEWKIVSSAASYSTDWTLGSGAWAALMATFKEAPSVAVTPVSDDYWTNMLASTSDTIVTVWG